MIKIGIIPNGKWIDVEKVIRNSEDNIDQEIERAILKMAIESHKRAPVLHYVLAPSIMFSPDKLGKAHYIYGTAVPYGRRWEYEHRTKSGYFRKSVENHLPELTNRILTALEKGANSGA